MLWMTRPTPYDFTRYCGAMTNDAYVLRRCGDQRPSAKKANTVSGTGNNFRGNVKGILVLLVKALVLILQPSFAHSQKSVRTPRRKIS